MRNIACDKSGGGGKEGGEEEEDDLMKKKKFFSSVCSDSVHSAVEDLWNTRK